MAVETPEIHDLFNEALARDSGEERCRYLDDACGNASQLRERVEALLRAHFEAGSFLGGQSPPGSVAVPILESVGTMIGPYKLLEQIGTGGMGAVYMAEQKEPVRRKVALKVIKPGMDTREVIARFEAERQALAMMNHPHIAKVLDAGSTVTGRPYFVMELVKGAPITDFCDGQKLDTRERLQLFITVCQAVQHAHQKGLIHRDLKPSNVLVEMHDVTPVPKVIDFGVAKAIGQQLTEKTLHTGFYQMLGTPMYMSPEQARQSSLDVDTRSDVYSLGVLLYELLTGQTPFDKETFSKVSLDEMRRIIREDEPPRPSQRVSNLAAAKRSTISQTRRLEPRRLSASLSGELDWIVMKALEKDRARRYESASALAADVQRYLNDEPVEACPPTWTRVAARWSRRHYSFVAATVVVLLLSMAGLIASTVLISRERDAVRASESQARGERRVALVERDHANYNLYLADMHLAHQEWHAGRVSEMQKLLDAHVPAPGEPDLRGWEWRYLVSLSRRDLATIEAANGRLVSLAWSPDSRLLATRGDEVQIWDAATRQLITTIHGGHNAQRTGCNIAWSPDGTKLATAAEGNVVKVWDPRSGKELRALGPQEFPPTRICWSPDNTQLAMGDVKGNIWLWEVTNEVPTIQLHEKCESVSLLVWSPDGKLLALAGFFGEEFVCLEIWDPIRRQRVQSLSKLHASKIHGAAWSPDSRRLATASNESLIDVWDSATWVSTRRFRSRIAGHMRSLSWSADGKWLVSGSAESNINVWDAKNGELVNTLRGHRGSVNDVAWSPDSNRLASVSSDQTVKFWDPFEAQDARQIHGRNPVAWSPNGREIVAKGPAEPGVDIASAHHNSGLAQVFDPRTGKVDREFRVPDEEHLTRFDWSSDGGRIAVTYGEGQLLVWDAANGRELWKASGISTSAVAWNIDGRLLATAAPDSAIKIWDSAAGRLFETLRGHESGIFSLAWSPDGRRLGSIDALQNVKVWNTSTWREELHLRCLPFPAWHSAGNRKLAWNPSGTRLAAGTSTGSIVVWNTDSGRDVYTLDGHSDAVNSVSWSPDGTRLASGATDATIKIWDVATGRQVLFFDTLEMRVGYVAWSPDGRRLAGAGGDARMGGPRIRIWDATAGYEEPR